MERKGEKREREKEGREKEGREKGGRREGEGREKGGRWKGGRREGEGREREGREGGRAKGGKGEGREGGRREGREKEGREYTGRTRVDLPPDTRTLSELTARVLISAWWPVKFCRKLPSGNFQILMLSGEAEAKQNLKWEVLFTTTQSVEDVEPSNSPGWRRRLTQRDGGPGLARSSCGW